MTSRHAVLILALAGACSSQDPRETPDAPDAVATCVFGDPSAPLEIEIIHYEADQVRVTRPDDELPLVAPGQGIGDVVLIGARVTNVEGCYVNLVTSFHDICDAVPLKVDSRPAQLQDAGDGWAVMPYYTVSPLQVCTSPTAQRLTQGQPFVFTVDVTDAQNRHATKSVTATPTCPVDAPGCICQCHPDFVLGGTCPPGPDPVPPSC
jgi:hypothetical protein